MNNCKTNVLVFTSSPSFWFVRFVAAILTGLWWCCSRWREGNGQFHFGFDKCNWQWWPFGKYLKCTHSRSIRFRTHSSRGCYQARPALLPFPILSLNRRSEANCNSTISHLISIEFITFVLTLSANASTARSPDFGVGWNVGCAVSRSIHCSVQLNKQNDH